VDRGTYSSDIFKIFKILKLTKTGWSALETGNREDSSSIPAGVENFRRISFTKCIASHFEFNLKLNCFIDFFAATPMLITTIN